MHITSATNERQRQGIQVLRHCKLDINAILFRDGRYGEPGARESHAFVRREHAAGHHGRSETEQAGSEAGFKMVRPVRRA